MSFFSTQLLRSRSIWCLLAMLTAPMGAVQAQEAVAAQGIIVPRNGLVHVAAPAGQTGQGIVAKLEVSAGDVVEAGALIATLLGQDAAQADLSAAQAEASAAAEGITIAKAQLEAAQARIEATQAEILVAEKNVAGAQADSATAQSGVVEAEAGVNTASKARREALDKLDAAMAKLTAMNAAHQSTLERWDPPRRETEEIKFQQTQLNEEYRELSASRSATVARLDAEGAAAEAALQTAQSKAAGAQSAVETAQAQLAAAQAGLGPLQAQVKVAEAQIDQAEASANAAQAAVDQAQVRLAMTSVFAPAAGTILHADASPGEAVGPAGVVTMGDLTQLYVDAEVYIDDVRKIKPGQSVTVTSDAFAGQLTGSVDRVGQLVNPQGIFSNDPLAYTDTRVVIVRIKLDSAGDAKPPVRARVVARIKI